MSYSMFCYRNPLCDNHIRVTRTLIISPFLHAETFKTLSSSYFEIYNTVPAKVTSYRAAEHEQTHASDPINQLLISTHHP